MTWDEFDATWFPAHMAAFTGIRDFLRKATAGTDAPTHDAILRSWYGVLRDVDLDAALEATAAMARGDVEEPMGFDRHPRAVRKAAGLSRSGGKRLPWDDARYDPDGGRLYSCLLCLDSGWVLCWHPRTVADVAKRGITPDRSDQPVYTTVYRCTCHAGDLRPQVGDAPRFDPKRALPYDRLRERDEQFRELEVWIGSREPVRPKNYEPSFEEFSK